jgi:hypothetical protein
VTIQINKHLKKIIIIFLIFFHQISLKAENYNVGQVAENNFKIGKRVIIELPEGKFKVFDKWRINNGTMSINEYGLIKVENKTVTDVIYIADFTTGGKYIGALSQWVEEILFKDKYDGCYERPEYYFIKFYRKGMSFNCLVVRHLDANKEIYSPDDPHALGPVKLRQWLALNPSVSGSHTYLTAYHDYYSPRAGGIGYSFTHSINPIYYGGPVTNYADEKQSEYHKSNIENYPEVKDFMEKWLSVSINRHKIFEKNVRSRKEHQIKFNNVTNTTFNSQNNDDNLVDKILELKKLLDEGIITNEEFTKMKKRILN